MLARTSVSTQLNYGGYSFIIPSLNNAGVILVPKPYPTVKFFYHSKIIEDLDTVWNIHKFAVARAPVEVGVIPEINAFCHPVTRILDMPIKLSGSNEYKIPAEMIPFLSTIQMIIDHEHFILSSDQLLSYNAYLTIDQSDVKRGKMQRKPGAHVDGFQGARIFPKTKINHSYVVSNGTPTVFYPQSFDFSHLDERLHNFFLEMDEQAVEDIAVRSKPYTVYLMDAYTVHRADIASEDCFRTFLRISYDVKPFDRLGNTINPMLSYDWEMVPREAQTTLVKYQSLSAADEDILANTDPNKILKYLEELKKLNTQHYYNLVYCALNTNKNSLAELALLSLNMTHTPAIQELRLLFIAAVKIDLKISTIGKQVLFSQLLQAKKHITNTSLLDFIIEIYAQAPRLLPTRLIFELVKGSESSPQGKEILRQCRKINLSYLWKTPIKKPDTIETHTLPLTAKL